LSVGQVVETAEGDGWNHYPKEHRLPIYCFEY